MDITDGAERDPGGAQEGGMNPAPTSNRSRRAATGGRPYEERRGTGSGRREPVPCRSFPVRIRGGLRCSGP